MADDVHGTLTAINAHKRDHTSLCPACSITHADYQRGRRILHDGAKRQTTISAGSLALLLAGMPVVDVLRREYGPLTIAALAELSVRGGRRA